MFSGLVLYSFHGTRFEHIYDRSCEQMRLDVISAQSTCQWIADVLRFHVACNG